jgi:hypothetical protein
LNSVPTPAILKPALFGAVVAAFYGLALFPGLEHARFDPSVFVTAGDRFVNSGALDAPVIVRKHSDGYDGQFYYRLALDPRPANDGRHGVTFDSAAARGQRILYPLLVWIFSLGGNPKLVPAMLVLVNLAAVGVAGAMSVCLARVANLPRWAPFAIALWPGFVITVTHDTTELAPQAFILVALWAWASRRFWLFSIFAGLAPLAREVSVLVPLGFLIWSMGSWLRGRSSESARQVLACALALVPCLAWRETLTIMLHAPVAASSDLGWPGLGWLRTVERIVAPHAYSALPPLNGDLGRRMALATASAAGFLLLVGSRLNAASKCRPLAPLIAAWSMTAILMTLLTATGPWVEDIAIFRAFTECFVFGIIILGMAGAGWRVAVPVLSILVVLMGVMWVSALRHISV